MGSLNSQLSTESTVHPAQVAGVFYPHQEEPLRSLIQTLTKRALSTQLSPKIAVIPHAGLKYSGIPAATSILPWALRSPPVSRVVIIGPAHRYAFKGLATHPATQWRTPLGDVPVLPHLQSQFPEAQVLPAAFEKEHALEVPLVMLQGLLPHPFEIVPILLGDCTTAEVASALRRFWGGPETVLAISSDLSHFLQLKACQEKDRQTATLIETFQSSQLTGAEACGFRAVAGALEIAAAQDMRITTLQLTNSAAAGGDPNRVVGYGSFGFEYAASARLSEEDRTLLLNTAMVGLSERTKRKGATANLISQGALAPGLLAHRACFVTLLHQSRLRGCVGSVVPHRPLVGDVFLNTLKAGFEDKRFPPLATEELTDLTISISILSHRRELRIQDETELIKSLEPDRDGLILQDQNKSALFLPSVWSSLPNPTDFVRHLKTKAGWSPSYWSPSLKVFRFRTESFSAPFSFLEQSSIAPLILQEAS